MPFVSEDTINKILPVALLAVGITLIVLGTHQERKAQKAIEEIRFWSEVLHIFNKHITSSSQQKHQRCDLNLHHRKMSEKQLNGRKRKKPRSLFFKRKYPQITTPPFKPLVAELKIELLEVKQTDINNTIDSIISDLMNNENLQVLLINDLADILF